MKSSKELRKLYKENRFLFEIERRRMINEFISNAPEEYQRQLYKLQAKWDKAMRGASNKHDRFILAQTLFYEQIEKFRSAINSFVVKKQ